MEPRLYRVVHDKDVWVRDAPNGKIVGTRKPNDLVRTDAFSKGHLRGWVRLDEPVSAHAKPDAVGWMLVDGAKLNLGPLLELVDTTDAKATAALIKRYRVVPKVADVRDRPNGKVSVGERTCNRVVRSDLELAGWVRLQADFFRPGNRQPCEGWLPLRLGAALEPWTPQLAPSVAVPTLRRADTFRMWVTAPESAVVRERPWGRVVARKARGALVRCDALCNGWVRLEEDFVERDDDEGDRDRAPHVSAAALGFLVGGSCEEEDALQLLEGWMLVDGRDLGLERQLVAYDGECEAPTASPPDEYEMRATEARERARREATAAAGGATSLHSLLAEAALPEEVATKLDGSGVTSLDELIRVASMGDAHEELRHRGISKVGHRQKLTSLVQPFWLALGEKEQGNELYRQSRFDEACRAYSDAIERLPSHATSLALNCFSNRAACHQQLRENKAALDDATHVLRYDPLNPKALARKRVNLEALVGD